MLTLKSIGPVQIAAAVCSCEINSQNTVAERWPVQESHTEIQCSSLADAEQMVALSELILLL